MSSLTNPELLAIIGNNPQGWATVADLAHASNLSAEQVMAQLADPIAQGALRVDPVAGTLFVHTAPHGRPDPGGVLLAPANRWELLCTHQPQPLRYPMWRTLGSFESAGWQVSADRSRVLAGCSAAFAGQVPGIGVFVGDELVPVALSPEASDLLSVDALLGAADRGARGAVALACDNGELAATVTNVRRWFLSRPSFSKLTVLVLEAPRYAPVAVRADDPGVRPASVTLDPEA